MRLPAGPRLFAVRPAAAFEVHPTADGWRRLQSELTLARHRAPWWRRVGFWRQWALGRTAVLVPALSINLLPPTTEPVPNDVAQPAGESETATAAAALSADGRTLRLRATRPVIAGPAQSDELWLIPAEAGAPVSLAVLLPIIEINPLAR
jgi:anti-sigma-K factor RskA